MIRVSPCEDMRIMSSISICGGGDIRPIEGEDIKCNGSRVRESIVYLKNKEVNVSEIE